MFPKLVLLLFAAIPCLSHRRLFWPWPRSDDTAPTSSAPCGGVTFEQAYEQERVTNWNAGETVTIIIYEQIYHGGQPMRLAISGENDEDFDSCIWLNHVPQHVRGDGQNGRNLTIELTVPDMTCRNCTLQLIGFQTGGFSDGQCCAYQNNDTKSCELNQYYSCANINIVGGSRSRDQVCKQPSSWPYRGFTCNYYKDERSTTAWVPEEADPNTLWLKMDNIEQMPEQGQFCKESEKMLSEMGHQKWSACHSSAVNFGEVSLLEGGDMQAEGVVGIIVVLLLAAAITATYCIAKKRNESMGSSVASASTSQMK